MKLSKLKVDAKKETDGVWVEVGEGLELLIAGADNPEYRKYRDKLVKPFIRRVRTNLMSAEDTEDITRRAMARYVLLGWRGLEDDDGNPIQYSEKKALEILRESRELFNIVADFASDRALFRAEVEGESEKNS
jgi:hypothetical protein